MSTVAARQPRLVYLGAAAVSLALLIAVEFWEMELQRPDLIWAYEYNQKTPVGGGVAHLLGFTTRPTLDDSWLAQALRGLALLVVAFFWTGIRPGRDQLNRLAQLVSVTLLALLIAMAARRLLAAEFLDSWARTPFGKASFAKALAERLLFWLAILLVVANLSRVLTRR